MQKYAVIVAGGSGLRMNAGIPKQFLLLQGKPILWHTLNAFFTAYDDLQIILVLPANHLEAGQLLLAGMPWAGQVQITAGGGTRFQSVKNGLERVEKKGVVFVHDGVRCLVTPVLIKRCYEATMEKGNAVPATTAIDSIRIEQEQGNEVIDRSRVRLIQTPQTFFADTLHKAFEQPYEPGFTDEAGVVEKTGTRINLVEGEANNIKITRPIDILIATQILAARGSI